ncbi:MAG: hypothetical protein AAGH46_00180 [Bacteroidota bacterium]
MGEEFMIVVSKFVKPGAGRGILKNAQKKLLFRRLTAIIYVQESNSKNGPSGGEEYVILILFHSEPNYQVWGNSEQRNKWFG